MAIVAGQASPGERIAVREHFTELKLRRFVPQPLQRPDTTVDQGKIRATEDGVRPLDGEDEPAGKDLVGKSAAQELVTADTGTALGKKADVIVLGFAVPDGSGQKQQEPTDEPGCADCPGVGRR